MSVKFIPQPKQYTPVKIELTFDTKEQLEAFVRIYGSSNTVAEILFKEKYTKKNLRGAIEDTIPYDIWVQLDRMLDN
jgi:hypothetical protein